MTRTESSRTDRRLLRRRPRATARPWRAASPAGRRQGRGTNSSAVQRRSRRGRPRGPPSTGTPASPSPVEQKDGMIIVTSRLTGNFPGSPVDLRYAFRLEARKDRHAGDHAMSFDLDLATRRALVTGGTRGVGAAVVETLREPERQVVTTARSHSRLGGPKACAYVAADLSTAGRGQRRRSVGAAAARRHRHPRQRARRLERAGRRIRGARRCAVVEGARTRTCMPAVRLDRALLPSMIAQRFGVIIHVTSIQRVLPLA